MSGQMINGEDVNNFCCICFFINFYIKILMMNRVSRSVSQVLRVRAAFSEISKAQTQSPSRREYLQFSKKRLVDFGQLPFGEIPEALQSSRTTTVNKLSNGVRVATEYWPGHQTAITVNIKVGSRQQSLENSSVAQFVAHGALKGTQTYSKQQVEEWIDKFGGVLNVSVDRQITKFTLFFNKGQVAEAVSFLSEVILKPTYESVQVEALKSTIYKNTSIMDPFNNTLQMVHYTAFRDHYMGQPNTGIRENTYSITTEQVKQFHNQFYVGENIVVSAAGEVDASQFNDLVNQHFGSVKPSVEGQILNKDQPFFTPSLMFQRDDEIPNTSFGAAFVAPSWNDPDFFAMHYFTKIIGDYRVDKYTGAHLNSSHLQYNTFHNALGSYPDIIIQKPFYIPYSDTGLMGNFIFGNEIFNREMLLMTQNMLSCYAHQINPVEVFRARNTYWNDLLERNNPIEQSSRNAQQVSYLDRVIPRTEIATRISHMDDAYISRVAAKWFWDKETAVIAWGPLHNIINMCHYNRPYKRATLGQYSFSDVYLKSG